MTFRQKKGSLEGEGAKFGNESDSRRRRSADLGFFEPDVLAQFGVVFLQAYLLGGGPLILHRGVEIASSFFRNEADFDSCVFCGHGYTLEFFPDPET